MSRRKARETAVQALFYLEFNQTNPESAISAIVTERTDKISEGAINYARLLVTGTQEKQSEIDQVIAGVSNEWKLDRMAAVDRNIARIAVFEMKYGTEELPPNVIINEAVELAKTFGTEDSSRFINGILGSLVKKQEPK